MDVLVAGDRGRPPRHADGLAAAGDDPASEVVAEQRTFTFSEDDADNRFFINGQEFDADRVDAAPTRHGRGVDAREHVSPSSTRSTST